MRIKTVEWNNICRQLDELCERSTGTQINGRECWDGSKVKNVVTIAVDSSKHCAGAVQLTEAGGEPLHVSYMDKVRQGRWGWTKEHLEASINWKETSTAIMAVRKVIKDLRNEGKKLDESVVIASS